jgi:hypothetical protein
LPNTEAPFSISFRTAKATLITVRGDSNEELVLNLAKMSLPISTEDGPASAIDMIRDIEASIAGPAAGGSQPAPDGAGSQQASLTPPCKTCGGQSAEKSGTGKRGPWKGYFCTVNKDHDPQWA